MAIGSGRRTAPTEVDAAMEAETEGSGSRRRHTTSSEVGRKLFRRVSAQAMGMEAAALCHRSHWVPKSSRHVCSNCKRGFKLWAGKHHCRLCGEIVCGGCSTKRILFRSKSVRSCDDCVHVNVENLSARNRRRSQPEFERAHTSPELLDDDVGVDNFGFGRHSLQASGPRRIQSNRSLGRRSMGSLAESALTPRGSRRSATETKETTAVAVVDYCALYRLTCSWQTQVTALVIVALIISIAGVLGLMAQM